jgi:hypothetical protein
MENGKLVGKFAAVVKRVDDIVSRIEPNNQLYLKCLIGIREGGSVEALKEQSRIFFGSQTFSSTSNTSGTVAGSENQHSKRKLILNY